MKIESLNIGLPKREIFHGKDILTGICKTAVYGPLQLKKTGFEGDGVGDLKHHGGYDKAVCVYSEDHYGYWEELLGIKLPVAAFGENLSVSDLNESEICIGDIFGLGTSIVQVTQPRQPCSTLAARYGRSDLIKLVVDSGRTGFYLRVLKEGAVEKGSPFVLKQGEPHKINVAFASHVFHHEKSNCGGLRKVLEVPALSESWRCSFLELIEKCS